MEYRHAVFAVMSHHFGVIGTMVNGKTPFNAVQASANAILVETMAKLPWEAFPESSERVEGSRANVDVWKEREKFRALADRFELQTINLVAACKSGDEVRAKAAFVETALTCKSCHDHFRTQ